MEYAVCQRKCVSLQIKTNAMHKYISTIFVLLLTALFCSGQSFLGKYPKLTKKNLPEFFEDWQAYSDSVAGTVNCHSDICNAVNAEFDSCFHVTRELQSCVSHYVKRSKSKEFGIIPQNIPVEYYPISPTPNDTLFFSWGYYQMHFDKMVEYTITPRLRPNELYLTSNIDDRLMEFLAGKSVAHERPAKYLKKNIKELKKYLWRYNGDFNGGVIFNNFPYVYYVRATNDFIVLSVRDGYYTGYEIWYIKKDGKFERVSGKHNTWIA